MNQNTRTLNTIIVSPDVWRWLRNKQRASYGYKEMTDEEFTKLYRRYSPKKPDGRVVVSDDAMYFGTGQRRSPQTPRRCSDLKRMLDEAGLPYEDGEPVEVIPVYF